MPGVGSTTSAKNNSSPNNTSPLCMNNTALTAASHHDVLAIIRSVTSSNCSPSLTPGPESPVGLLTMATTQTEKPCHYRYLKEFRVEQCMLFPQHKCAQHRPFTCFNWHFPNQRRRRPVKKRDGTFNYSPDSYCTKYDETSGTCPDGDDCPLLHRTAGDTERRYHLRYFKTCMCVYETDGRGMCTKNGAHCAFAHGEIDKRPPVFDIRETQNPDSAEDQMTLMGPNQLDKERNMMIDDPKWQGEVHYGMFGSSARGELAASSKWDATYVLAHYKTEPCRRPPRLCRQGYACPQYHNQRDRRRSPKRFKYRSTPCPSVKHGDEWGEPTACEQEDECPYCHTRTEQQFHPEIYKSSRCHDVFTSQYCPRGPFCAFAHTDAEMQINRNLPLESSLADILSTVLPSCSTNVSSSPSTTNLPNKPESNNNNHILESNGSTSSTSLNMNNNIGNGGTSISGPGSGIDIFSSGRRMESPSSEYGSSFGGGTPFGTQSFASAVTASYSSAASGGLNNGGMSSKSIFEDANKKDIIGDSLDMNGSSSKSNTLIMGPALMDSLMGYQDSSDDIYSLFPSTISRPTNDSPNPNALDKEGDTEHFGGTSDISALSGTDSKPVSIPSPGFFQQNRDRFPSGSSPMASSLSNYNPIGSLFNKSDSIDQGNDFLNNHSSPFFEFSHSPRQTSALSQSSTSNGYHVPLPSRPSISTSAIVTGNGGISNNTSGSGPGLIGSPSVMGSQGGSGKNSGASGSGLHAGLGHLTNQIGSTLGSDVAYLSKATLTQYQAVLKYQLELVEAALATHREGDPRYCCLSCEVKERYRSVTLVPCEHQVLCTQCANHVAVCPLCHTPIENRKYSTVASGAP